MSSTTIMKWQAVRVVKKLQAAGYQSYLIGGCIRDAVIDRESKDIDIVTSATPDLIEAVFEGQTKPIGAKFGVVQVRQGEFDFEVATFRSDGAYSDHRRPEDVRFSESLAEDVCRRDFTMNGIAYNPATKEVTDLTGGLEDIRANVIRCIGDPERRFDEDALRMLRAIRFAVQLDFRIELKTWDALCTNAHLIKHISKERVRDEIAKMLMSDNPARALFLLNQAGLLEILLPNCLTAFAVILRSLDYAAKRKFGYLSRLALVTNGDEPGLMLSNTERETIVSGQNDYFNVRFLTEPAQRIRLLRSIGRNVAMNMAETYIVLGRLKADRPWDEIQHSFDVLDIPEIRDQKPFVTGDDLIARGWKPDPHFKPTLFYYETEQLNGRFKTREEALARLDTEK